MYLVTKVHHSTKAFIHSTEVDAPVVFNKEHPEGLWKTSDPNFKDYTDDEFTIFINELDTDTIPHSIMLY